MPDAKTIQDNRTRAQKAKEIHEKANKERAEKLAATKAVYQANRTNAAIMDIQDKGNSFIAYHNKIAQDGVGARPTGYKLQDGSQETETYYLTNDQRAGHLDKSAGIQELLGYIERQTKIDVAPVQAATEEETSEPLDPATE